MSKNTNPSLFKFAMHCFLLLITAGLWIIPIALHYFIMWATGSKPSALLIAGHCIAGLLTGGFWFLFAIVWYLMKR